MPKLKCYISLEANKLREIEKKLHEIEESIKQVENEKEYLLSAFGIWASLVAFITVEFNFLKTLSSWQEYVGFSLILTALLLGFNMSLDLLSKLRVNNNIPRGHCFFYGFIVLLLITGYGTIYFGSDKLEKKKICDSAYTELEKRHVELCKEYEQKAEKEIQRIDSSVKFAISQVKLELQEMQASRKD